MELLETLKQARDAMKQVDSRPNGLWNIKTELANLTTAIEQLEKAEPVARLMRYIGKDPYPFALANQSRVIARTYEELPEGMYDDIWEKVVELYTHPAAPQWQPTDEELTAIYKEANGELEGKSKPISTQRIFAAMRAMLSAAPGEKK